MNDCTGEYFVPAGSYRVINEFQRSLEAYLFSRILFSIFKTALLLPDEKPGRFPSRSVRSLALKGASHFFPPFLLRIALLEATVYF